VRAAPERLPAGEGDAPAELPLALAERPEAAGVVMDVATREVLALVGGYHHRAGTVDRAQRPRAAGRHAAPFVYAAALESRQHTLLQLRRPFIEALDSHLPVCRSGGREEHPRAGCPGGRDHPVAWIGPAQRKPWPGR
jgi:penicillin-binding protein 1A